jgi:hypothetical protein
MKEIAAALVKAQKAFGPALKTSSNPAFRSKYAKLENCIDAVIDALNDNGIMLMQQTHPCEDGVIVETIFIHESGETMSGGKLHVPAAKHDPQGYGSALTYARRYSLQAACGIAPEDDDGNMATSAMQPKQPAPKPAAPKLEPKPAAPAAPIKAPTAIEGKDNNWQLKVSAEPDGDHGEWSQLVIDATALQLTQAQNEIDVMSIFKTNRNIYEEVKKGSPTAFVVLLEEFKQAKTKHKEAS